MCQWGLKLRVGVCALLRSGHASTADACPATVVLNARTEAAGKVAIETKMSADMQALLEDASPWGKHAPVYKLAAAAKETSLDALGEEDEDDEGQPRDES